IPGSKTPLELVQKIRAPLDFQFHRPVVTVANPAGQLQRIGQLLREPAKTHSLYGPAHEHVSTRQGVGLGHSNVLSRARARGMKKRDAVFRWLPALHLFRSKLRGTQA